MRRTLFLLLTLNAFAQAAPEIEITAEPHHHLTFTNDQIRVFYVEAPPHSETLMHWHRHDYVFVTLGDSNVVSAVKGKDPVTLKLADGETRFTPGNFAHITRNLSDQPFRNVTIELLQDEKLRSAHAQQDAADTEKSRGLEILHGGTQEVFWVHDGVRASLFELQPGGVDPGQQHSQHAGPELVVAVADSNLFEGVPVKGFRPSPPLGSGEVRWLPAGSSHMLTNVGKKTAKFVTLEFP